MNEKSSKDFIQPRDFGVYDIEEVSSEDEENNAINAGEVKAWKHLEAGEKTKTRLYITRIVVSLWVIWTLVGLIKYFTAGDISLLISSPTLLIFPVRKVLEFYFKE
jgi:hypothetical protein